MMKFDYKEKDSERVRAFLDEHDELWFSDGVDCFVISPYEAGGYEVNPVTQVEFEDYSLNAKKKFYDGDTLQITF